MCMCVSNDTGQPLSVCLSVSPPTVSYELACDSRTKGSFSSSAFCPLERRTFDCMLFVHRDQNLLVCVRTYTNASVCVNITNKTFTGHTQCFLEFKAFLVCLFFAC